MDPYVLDFYCAAPKLAIERTVVDITIVRAKLAIKGGRNCLLVGELLYCDFGIIKFARNSTAFYKRFG